jgi:hypothetical protein
MTQKRMPIRAGAAKSAKTPYQFATNQLIACAFPKPGGRRRET